MHSGNIQLTDQLLSQLRLAAANPVPPADGNLDPNPNPNPNPNPTGFIHQ